MSEAARVLEDAEDQTSPKLEGTIEGMSSIEDYALSLGHHLELAYEPGGIWRVGSPHRPRLMVVDVDAAEGLDMAVDDLLQIAEGLAAGKPLLAVGSSDTISLYRAVTDAGAFDYLLKPVAEAEFQTALKRLDERPAGEAAPDSRLMVVVGARGGVGATTVAINLAWALGEEKEIPTLLIDPDLIFGGGAFQLDVEPGRGLAEAVASPDRLDNLLLTSSIAKVGKRLSLLASEEGLDGLAHPSPEAFARLVEQLRQDQAATIIDMPRHLLGHHIDLLRDAERILIVADLTLAAAKDAARIKKFCETRDCPGEISIVLNRAGGAGEQLDRQNFEKATGVKVEHVLPEDAKGAAEAANSGRPLFDASPSSKLTKGLTRLADSLSGEEADEQPAGRSLFARLMGRK